MDERGWLVIWMNGWMIRWIELLNHCITNHEKLKERMTTLQITMPYRTSNRPSLGFKGSPKIPNRVTAPSEDGSITSFQRHISSPNLGILVLPSLLCPNKVFVFLDELRCILIGLVRCTAHPREGGGRVDSSDEGKNGD